METPWIRTPEAIVRLRDRLRGASVLALDSESDSLYHHVEKVCLLQIASENGDAWLVDTLAVRDLSPLAGLFADPSVTKVLHGADYDVTTLKRDFGFVFAGLFDTMIASRFLGFPEIGLQSVARRELGVELTKASQKDDWSRRPLTSAQESYALADVRHLVALHGRLVDQLRAQGRLSWVLEESAAVATLEPARRRRDKDAYQKIKGARRLTARSLAVLRELFAWRETRAETTDLPAFKIAGNEALLTLASSAPRTREDLRALKLGRLAEHAPALLAAVQAGLAVPDTELPEIPRDPRPIVSEEVRRRAERLRAWRAEAAREAALDPAVLLPQRLIDRLAETAPRDEAELGAMDGLRRWRVERFGHALVRALRAP